MSIAASRRTAPGPTGYPLVGVFPRARRDPLGFFADRHTVSQQRNAQEGSISRDALERFTRPRVIVGICEDILDLHRATLEQATVDKLGTLLPAQTSETLRRVLTLLPLMYHTRG